MFGDEKYAAELLMANPELDDVLVFEGGEALRIPVVEEEDDGYVPLTAPWRYAE